MIKGLVRKIWRENGDTESEIEKRVTEGGSENEWSRDSQIYFKSALMENGV